MENCAQTVNRSLPRHHFALLPLRPPRLGKVGRLQGPFPIGPQSPSNPSSNFGASIRNLEAWTVRAKLSKERTFRLAKQKKIDNTSCFPGYDSRSMQRVTSPNLNVGVINTIMNPQTLSNANAGFGKTTAMDLSRNYEDPSRPPTTKKPQGRLNLISETELQRQIVTDILSSEMQKPKRKTIGSSTQHILEDVEEHAQKLLHAFQSVRERINVRSLGLPAIARSIGEKRARVQLPRVPEAPPVCEQAEKLTVIELELEEIEAIERALVTTVERIKDLKEKTKQLEGEIVKSAQLIDKASARQVA